MGAIDYNSAARILRPPPDIAVWEWANSDRVLSTEEAAEPGQWRTDRTPYLREIMEVMSPRHPAQVISVKKGAQVGVSEAALNRLGFTMAHAPAPVLVVMPTEGTARDWSRDRLGSMIRSTPKIAELFGPSTRNPKNSTFRKKFPGGYIKIAWAGSPAELRSKPIQILILEECDGYDKDVGGEGDPCEIAERRTSTFGIFRKVIKISTPTFDSTSRIKPAFLEGDQRLYFVPCLDCGKYQTIIFDQLKWPRGKPQKARFECKHCAALHQEQDKTEMLAAGEWRPQNEDAPDWRVSFYLSSLYSPAGWLSWGEAASKFYEATSENSKPKLRTFRNTILGKTWRDSGETPDWEKLYLRCEPYRIGTVPEGGLVLTAGVDVQADRLEMEIVAWGEKLRSWSVDYVVIPGDPSDDEVWEKLEERIHRTYEHESGAELQIQRVAVDSGYKSQSVYRFCRREPKAMAIKGSARLSRALGTPTGQDVDSHGNKIRNGVQLWKVGVSVLKDELYSWLLKPLPSEDDKEEPRGWCHFPEYEQEHFRRLTAEERKYVGEKMKWIKVRERNEQLDCRIYARAASIALELDRWDDSKWKQERDYLEDSQKKRETTDKAKRTAHQRRRQKSNDDWLGVDDTEWL